MRSTSFSPFEREPFHVHFYITHTAVDTNTQGWGRKANTVQMNGPPKLYCTRA